MPFFFRHERVHEVFHRYTHDLVYGIWMFVIYFLTHGLWIHLFIDKVSRIAVTSAVRQHAALPTLLRHKMMKHFLWSLIRIEQLPWIRTFIVSRSFAFLAVHPLKQKGV